MDQLSDLYTSINRRGRAALLNGQAEIDNYLQTGVIDGRRGLTLLAHLPVHVGRNIGFCLQEVAATAPGQYYYPGKNMHITVIDLLAGKSDFHLDRQDFERYRQVLGKIIGTTPEIHFQLKGLIVSPGALMVKGYYSSELEQLRQQIRQQLPQFGLTVEERYPTYSGHVTVARFRQPFSAPANFLRVVNENKELAFGSFTLRSLDLVVHDWYNQQIDQRATLPLGQ